MKKFNKASKKQHQMVLQNAEATSVETPQQSMLEKELVKQITNKTLPNNSGAKTTTTVANSYQSSVIVNYENSRKLQQTSASQFVHNATLLKTQDGQDSLRNPNIVDVIDVIKEETLTNEKDGIGNDPLKTERDYEDAEYYNGDDNRVDQNSNSPIMLTTMQPVPVDHPVPITPVHNEQSLQHSPEQMEQDFLRDNGEVFVHKTNGEMIIQGHAEDGHIYQNIQQSLNIDSQQLVIDSTSNANLMRQVSQGRDETASLRNAASLETGSLVSPENSLPENAGRNILAKRLLGGNTDYLSQNNILPAHSLQDQQLDDPSQPQKTVIYLQSTTNENGQQTFIYDPAMQTQHIPTEIVGGLLQSSGLVSGGSSLVNLQDGTGGTTVLVLQEMPVSGDLGVGASSDGAVTGVVGDMMSSDAAALTTANGGMTALSNVAASATKIPTVVGFRKRKDTRGGAGGGGDTSGRMSDLAAESSAGGGGGHTSSTSTSAAEDPGWRAYYEHQHPLSAATSAMLNINGSGAGEPEHGGGPGGAVGAGAGGGGNTMPPLIYEYYKIPQLGPAGGGQADKDVWPSTSLNQSVLTSGGSLVGTSASLLTTSSKLGSASSQGQLLDPNALHAQSNLQDLSLFLHQQTLLPPGIVKREPEDLSHRRASPNMSDLKKSKIVLVGAHAQNADSLVIDVVNNNNTIKDEFSPHNRNGGTTPSSICSDHTMSAPTSQQHHMELINTDNIKHTSLYSTMTSSGSSPPMSQYNIEYATAPGGSQFTTNTSSQLRNLSTADTQYYREYFNSTPSSDYSTNQVRTGTYVGGADMESSLMERYVRSQQGPGAAYHAKSVISASGLTVDLPSPDSGIGADTITPRDPTAIHQSFDYSDMCSPANLMGGADNRVGVASSPGSASNRSRPWHDFGRQNDADKIQIPKLFSSYGFKYTLETPISTNQRREDDRVTYINKGQFYGITMEYIPDPDKPLKSQTVKSIVMLMFREEKSPEDEIKAWQFWHSRQHSVKQRILDADTKNSVGLVGCIEEISHNAIAVYWNPLESPAKINIAVQCLSTDFSSQKGVKGLPLHVQIDTYDDPRDGPVLHRGYVQLKVFCDKGAERKTRDEERRAAKRKMTATGRKKMDELYHAPCERSEFYTMADTNKPPVLFSPAEDIDKIASMELGFYGHEDTSSLSNGEGGGSMKHGGGGGGGGSPFLIHSKPPGTPTPPTLKFHNHFPPDTHSDKKDLVEQVSMTTDGTVFSSLPLKRPKLMPPINERVMLYVRQEADEIYTPLHVSPPTTQGLLNALELKYNINASNICNLLRKNLKGIIVKMDDEMLKYYCNEDLFLLEVEPATDKPESDLINIILCEIDS